MSPETPHNLALTLDSIIQGLPHLGIEILLVATFLLAIVAEIFPKGLFQKWVAPLSIGGVGVATVLAVVHLVSGKEPVLAFSDMISVDRLGSAFKVMVFLPAILSMSLAWRSRKLKGEADGMGEYFMMTLALVVGLSFLIMSRHLLMVFLSLEMVSLPAYILTAYARRNRNGAESALKYVIFGCFSSGIMAYGLSWLFGLAGTLDPHDAQFLSAFQTTPLWIQGLVLLMVLGGFAFKIGVFPFHFWVPDVYEGAPYPAASFFSVAPKIAGIVAMMRFLGVFHQDQTGDLRELLTYILAVISLGSMFVGNLSALFQPKLRRMLAFSSIAHAGYLLVGLAAMSQAGEVAVAFYLSIYAMMTYGAFMVAGWMNENHGSESLDDFRGLGTSMPGFAFVVVVLMVSLAGLPPTAGFIAKLEIFLSAMAGTGGEMDVVMIVLMVAVVLNTVIGLFYYLRPAVMMLFKNPGISSVVPLHGFQGVVLTILAICVLILGVFAFDAWINFLGEVVKEIHVNKRF